MKTVREVVRHYNRVWPGNQYDQILYCVRAFSSFKPGDYMPVGKVGWINPRYWVQVCICAAFEAKVAKQGYYVATDKDSPFKGGYETEKDWYDYGRQKDLVLPPAGTVCEFRINQEGDEKISWCLCEVLFSSVTTVVFEWFRNDLKVEEACYFGKFHFRPLDHLKNRNIKRDEWVRKALSLKTDSHICSGLPRLYDALKSGELPQP